MLAIRGTLSPSSLKGKFPSKFSWRTYQETIKPTLTKACVRKILWSKSKTLQRMGKVFTYNVSNGNVKIKITQNTRPITISHPNNKELYFPNVDLNPPG